jgi:hypothetical protein
MPGFLILVDQRVAGDRPRGMAQKSLFCIATIAAVEPAGAAMRLMPWSLALPRHSRANLAEPMGEHAMRASWRLALMILSITVTGSAAAAEPDTQAFAKRLFAHDVAAKGKTYACFTRRYDAAHLAQHRQQKVKTMKLLVSAEIVPEDKQPNYSFQLAVSFRDRKGNFETSGDCGHPSASEETPDRLHLGCGVDCDGGGISIEMANGDQSTLVRIDQVAIWNKDKPDAERDGFNGGADDKVFRLDRVDLDACKSLISETEGVAAM